MSGSEEFLGLKSFLLSVKDLLSIDDDSRYIINDTGFRRQAIDIERFCTFLLVAEMSIPREDLTVNLTVDSSSKYRLRIYRHLCVDSDGKTSQKDLKIEALQRA